MNRSKWTHEDMIGRLGENPTILTVVAKGLVTVGNLLLLLPSLLVTIPVLLVLSFFKALIPGGVLLLVPF